MGAHCKMAQKSQRFRNTGRSRDRIPSRSLDCTWNFDITYKMVLKMKVDSKMILELRLGRKIDPQTRPNPEFTLGAEFEVFAPLNNMALKMETHYK